jgi:hypothetical protein
VTVARTVVLAALAAGALLAAQGCDPSAQAAPTSSSHRFTTADAQAIYQTYLTASDTAAAIGDSATGLSIVADDAWEITHAQYEALTSAGAPVVRYQYGTPQFYVPTLTGYPQWFEVAVPRRALSTSPLGGASTTETQTLMVFAKAKSSAPWLLDGAAALEPGQSLPAIARDSAGYAIALATFDQSLLIPPNAVGATQASVVDEGPANPAAASIAPGPQTTELYTQQSALSSATAAKGLDYTWYMEGTSYPIFVLRTTDGGALVMYGMSLGTTTEHPNLTSGTPIPIPTNFQALLAAPTEQGYHDVVGDWTYQFAALDPPSSDQNGTISVIAATSGLTYTHAY